MALLAFDPIVSACIGMNNEAKLYVPAHLPPQMLPQIRSGSGRAWAPVPASGKQIAPHQGNENSSKDQLLLEEIQFRSGCHPLESGLYMFPNIQPRQSLLLTHSITKGLGAPTEPPPCSSREYNLQIICPTLLFTQSLHSFVHHERLGSLPHCRGEYYDFITWNNWSLDIRKW